MNPKYIIASRKYVYDVEKVINDLKDVAIDDTPITMEDVRFAVSIWARDDLSCSHGHIIDEDLIDYEEIG